MFSAQELRAQADKTLRAADIPTRHEFAVVANQHGVELGIGIRRPDGWALDLTTGWQQHVGGDVSLKVGRTW